MSYFDPTSQDDLKLLDSATAARSDLARLSAQAEADVIAAYTLEIPDGWYYPGTPGTDSLKGLEWGQVGVFLRWYADDASAVTYAPFTAAMKRAIARQIEALADEDTRGRGVKSESRGRRSVTYAASSGGSSASALSPAAASLLRPYSLLPVVWAV